MLPLCTRRLLGKYLKRLGDPSGTAEGRKSWEPPKLYQSVSHHGWQTCLARRLTFLAFPTDRFRQGLYEGPKRHKEKRYCHETTAKNCSSALVQFSDLCAELSLSSQVLHGQLTRRRAAACRGRVAHPSIHNRRHLFSLGDSLKSVAAFE